jgi:DNA-binding MarR family transcriptional regulator
MECSEDPRPHWTLTTLPPGIADRAGLLLVKVGMEFERRGVERLRSLGIDGRDYSMLAEAGSQAELATLCGLLPAQIVPALDALQEQGLVERRRDERDRRRSIVRITDDGRALLARADEAAEELERELLGDVGEELRGRLARAFDEGLRAPASAS